MPNDLPADPTGSPEAQPQTDDWHSDRLDLDAYLRRIAYTGPLDADEATLTALNRAHIAAIPFENLDVILGRGVAVDLEHVQAKLVNRGRGGYCYEHSMLFGAVLERLGFRVDRFLARTGDPAEHPRPRCHMVLRVGIGDRRWLVDVGFGSGLLAPLRLTAAGPQRQGAWQYELVRGQDSAWRLREYDGQRWTTILTFTEEPVYFVDIDVANDNTATNPNSPFVQRAVLVRKDDTSVRRLLGREYTVERPGQPVQQRQLTNDEYAELLRTDFGPTLSTGEIHALVAALGHDTTDGPPAPGLPAQPANGERADAADSALQFALIVASVRRDRLGPAVARWFLRHVQTRTDDPVDVIDLVELDLPDDLAGGADAEIFTKRIERADAIVVVTPEYNRSYPGTLKTAIDTALPEWRAKPVAFVSYGGISGGLCAVEQLRNVFAELHVVTMQATVSLPHVWDHIDEHGRLGRLERAESAADAMLRQLTWWARTLRNAKAAQPYDG